MRNSFPESFKEIADSMGIALYQRFSVTEASLFLRCPDEEVIRLKDNGSLGSIQLTETEVQFFGYQLLEYLLEHVTERRVPQPKTNDLPERIMRPKEVVGLTGLSRTTIWRMEKTGKFPSRVSLGIGSVGWRFSEISAWMQDRQDADGH